MVERRKKKERYMHTRPHSIHLLVNIITRRVKGRFVRTLSCATLPLSSSHSPPTIKTNRLPFGFSPSSLRVVINLRIRSIISAEIEKWRVTKVSALHRGEKKKKRERDKKSLTNLRRASNYIQTRIYDRLIRGRGRNESVE